MLNNNKKGLSAIIVTVLLIGLTIVAVGVVWAVVNGVLQRGASNTDLSAKCLDIIVTATSVTCGETPAVCVVRLERTGSRDDAISGVKMVFENAAGDRSASPATYSSPIAQLGNAQATGVVTGINTPTKVEVTVFFTDASGNTQYCPQPSKFSF